MQYLARAAVVTVILSALASVSVSMDGTAWAQGTGAKPVVETVTITADHNRLILTAGNQKTTIMADRIVRHDQQYMLQGKFRVLGPVHQEFRGTDAELSLQECDPGDGSRSKMLQLKTQKCLTTMESSQSMAGKSRIISRSMNSDGEWITMTLYLNPKTLYANAAEETK